MRQLTSDQQNALEIISRKQVTLIHGVTGSGKTEIYLQVAAKIIDAGKKVIVLVPEISLTPQTIERFAECFEIVTIHSRLTPKERREAWQKIINQEVDLVVGPRSAVFAPFEQLGLIIIDEEHDTSYKQDNNPRYQTLDVALKRGELSGAKVILGSATPSLETYYKFQNNHNDSFGYVHLPKRIMNRPLPVVELVDMRQELQEKNFSVLSRVLRQAIAERLKKKEKIILFLNRRGFSTFVSCRSCGYVLECDRCQVSLTYHKDGTAQCHYCDKKIKVPDSCPTCGSKYFKFFGAGTQKVEDELKKYFGQAKVLRMDRDTVKKRTAHYDILDEFKNGDADILLGTQMVAKGHDFFDVTLVGVISADVMLNLPDFRAAERTFQLLTQVAGRTGRGPKGGSVVVQTYNPDNYAIQAASRHDYQEFYEQELENRRQSGFPPFSTLTLVTVSAPDEKKVGENILKIAQRFSPEKILGPVPCALPKLRGFYRWQILLKDQDVNY